MSMSPAGRFEARRKLAPEDMRFSVAPMMDWSDRHCRYFHRLLSRRARLYTEMVTAQAVLRGARDRLLAFSEAEHPVALQVGGCDPATLAEAASFGEAFGYDEVNLNIGCPSDRVQGGQFGACLMRTPTLVGECVAAMKQAVRIPVTVKCRIGVDDQDPESALDALAAAVLSAGVDGIVVHARKAWLAGLSPKENREVPPLDYGRVHRLKAPIPQVPLAINGGIVTLDAARQQLAHVDGVMLGRAAYQNTDLLLEVDPVMFGQPAPFAHPAEAVEAFLPYVEQQLSEGVRLHAMTRHLLGLFGGRPGARLWRRHLGVEGVKSGAGAEVLREALRQISSHCRQAA
jgi:tRNA-dihydrouridine synthase A